MDHAIATKDSSLIDIPSTSLGRNSFGMVGDLLNGANRNLEETMNGKWNDDIAWWALAMSSGVDLLGTQATMKASVTYLQVAIKTWNEMIEPLQYDNACNGGIYWSRNRNSDKDNERLYKSSITNTEFMLLSARLTKQTGNTTYMRYAVDVYNWMKRQNLITRDFNVMDGGYAPSCNQKTTTLYSYNAGMMIAAISEMYIVTKDASYMRDMNNYVKAALKTFTLNGIIYEPECNKDSNGCEPRPIQKRKSFIAQLTKGLSYAYKVSNDETVKSNIMTVIDNSVEAMAKSCDEDWDCSYYWTRSNPKLVLSPYEQYPCAELLVAAAAIHSLESTPKAKTFTKKPGDPRFKTTNNGNLDESVGYKSLTSSLLVMSLILSLILF